MTMLRTRNTGRRGAVAGLLAMVATCWGGPLRVAVFERPHEEWAQSTGGIGRVFQALGATVAAYDTAKPATAQDADIIIFGSFVSAHGDYQRHLADHGAAIADFVSRGGVLMEFTQADQSEPQVPFLPDSLLAARNDEDLVPLLVHAPEHPLLAGLIESNTPDHGRPVQLTFPPHFGRHGNWESLTQFRGFRVLMGHDVAHERPILLEAAHGRGRFLLTSMYFDLLYSADGTLQAPGFYEQFARTFAGNLLEYAAAVKAGCAAAVVVTPPYEPPAPLPFVPGSFTLCALPDTQVYCERWPEHFYGQTRWIVENREAHNIRYVLHLGDITNRNTSEQWAVASKAIHTLHGQVPYALAPGNHDYGPGGGTADRSTRMNDYIGVATCEPWPTFGGVYEPGRLDNSYHVFEVRGQKFLIFALEFGPRDSVVAWVDQVASRHADHRMILITHAFTYSDDTIYDWRRCGPKQHWNPHAYPVAAAAEAVNDGQEMWEKVVSRHPGFIMTLSGHVLNDGLGRTTTTGVRGNLVHHLLANYQMQREGGEGYMRLVEFLPDGETVQIKTFSPSTGLFKTDPQNQFVLKLSPPLALQQR